MSREVLSLSGEPLWAVDNRLRRLTQRVDTLEQEVRRLATAVGEIAGVVSAGEQRRTDRGAAA